MTIRDKITAAQRKANTVAIIGWLAGVVGVVLGAYVHGAFGLLFFPGALVCVAGVLYMLFGIRCPQCRGTLGHMSKYQIRAFWGIPKRIRFCPFCGVDLDSELPEDEGATDPPT